MSAGFIHLSDIHFGQENGGTVWIHNDVKERLIEDVALVVQGFQAGRASGIIVTGDIAFSGKKSEYDEAADWLDQVAEAAGCELFDIQVVPGNHDIDRDEITPATELILEKIAKEGDSALDKFLDRENDREMLFRRFAAYRPFAEGYRCPLDTSAELAEERVVKLAPGRSIRFVRLNSALACSKCDVEGKLLLGARQRVLKKHIGEELIVLCHHPLHWFQDSEDALQYIRSRARIFISGHEHEPGVCIEKIDHGKDLMLLAAGATIPPSTDKSFTYCYNSLEFKWEENSDALSVDVRSREWEDTIKDFSDGTERPVKHDSTYILGCPNFQSAPHTPASTDRKCEDKSVSNVVEIDILNGPVADAKEEPMIEPYPLMLLHFFRDISAAQRIRILAALGAIPPDLKGGLNETIERRAFDSLVEADRADELWAELQKMIDEES